MHGYRYTSEFRMNCQRTRPPFEVIALKIRSAPRVKAVGQARAALGWLRQAGCERVFWKCCSTFDSTPEGNIGPVAEALMADLGAAQTINCPAFPENGRTFFMSNLIVGEQPLAESPTKDQSLTPMHGSSLMRILKPQVTRAGWTGQQAGRSARDGGSEGPARHPRGGWRSACCR